MSCAEITLAALRKELELIDRASMADLVHEFDIVAKAADAVFAELKSHWYTFGIGASGASHALGKFKGEYDLLLAQGKDKEASDLLKGTRESAETTLAMIHQLKDSRGNTADSGSGDYGKYKEAADYLQKAGLLSKVLHDTTQQEVQAQESLVNALEAQATVEQKINALKTAQKSNATVAEAKKGSGGEDFKAEAEAARRAQEEADRLWAEHYRTALGNLQQSEREKIVATEQGSQARLNAINEAIQEENKYGLQETPFYRALLTERVAVTRQMTDEQARIQAEAGHIAAQHEQRMGEIQLQADMEFAQAQLAGMRVY